VTGGVEAKAVQLRSQTQTRPWDRLVAFVETNDRLSTTSEDSGAYDAVISFIRSNKGASEAADAFTRCSRLRVLVEAKAEQLRAKRERRASKRIKLC